MTPSYRYDNSPDTVLSGGGRATMSGSVDRTSQELGGSESGLPRGWTIPPTLACLPSRARTRDDGRRRLGNGTRSTFSNFKNAASAGSVTIENSPVTLNFFNGSFGVGKKRLSELLKIYTE